MQKIKTMIFSTGFGLTAVKSKIIIESLEDKFHEFPYPMKELLIYVFFFTLKK